MFDRYGLDLLNPSANLLRAHSPAPSSAFAKERPAAQRTRLVNRAATIDSEHRTDFFRAIANERQRALLLRQGTSARSDGASNGGDLDARYIWLTPRNTEPAAFGGHLTSNALVRPIDLAIDIHQLFEEQFLLRVQRRTNFYTAKW